jgi:hypothetical protein
MSGGRIIVRSGIMSTILKTNGDGANVLRITTDKRGLAARYGVGIRTVEAWQGDGIIIGSRVATKWPTTLARKGCPFLDLP